MFDSVCGAQAVREEIVKKTESMTVDGFFMFVLGNGEQVRGKARGKRQEGKKDL